LGALVPTTPELNVYNDEEPMEIVLQIYIYIYYRSTERQTAYKKEPHAHKKNM